MQRCALRFMAQSERERGDGIRLSRYAMPRVDYCRVARHGRAATRFVAAPRSLRVVFR